MGYLTNLGTKSSNASNDVTTQKEFHFNSKGVCHAERYVRYRSAQQEPANWDRASIEKLLRENDRAVERAMVVLYRRQTVDEQAQGNTKHTNGRGFSACHASKGSYYARWCQSGKRLTGRYLDHAREIALHYVQQLLDEVIEKVKHRPRG